MKKYQTKDKSEFIIRKPVEADAANMIAYSKLVFASTDQLLNTVEEYTITIDSEKIWINNFLQNPNSIALVAELNNQIVGMLFFVSQTKKKNSHTGEFGVNVHPDFRSLGIGKALTEYLIDWAKAHAQIEKVSLQVFATNDKAIQLYNRLGFKEEGRFPKAIKQDNGVYADIIQMYLETK